MLGWEHGGLALALTLWGGLASLAWIAAGIFGVRSVAKARFLAAERPAAPAAWPRVSVVIAARDEAPHVARALEALLAQDYPSLEVVVVDDRSSDGTGPIVEAIAARDPRVVVRRVNEIPEGWLGKVHALRLGAEAARGSWILFTDADVQFRPGALRRAIAFATARGLDHLAVAPDVLTPGFWLDVTASAFAAVFMLGMRAVDTERPGGKAFVGIGGFNLVRADALARTPGFEWLRMEVLDDVGLGLMIRRAGGRQAFALGQGMVAIEWYGSLRAMARGLEKNLFGGVARYSLARVALLIALLLLFLIGPLVAMAQPWSWSVRASALAAALIVLGGAVLVHRRMRRRLARVVLAPAGLVVLAGFLVRSAIACRLRGGVVWRGTLYPLQDLKAGQRVRL